ncbi:uncharacterized protein LOC130640746 [Hydractinia symbiolongicarpus]|uniref:uncharacterized protein LOC130640746 n=1 Tax=Hydractinia symbiolongicarpus TaxID=13093 RepID=UPI002551AC84|nr:uncharacterized protein LOC130640746 [Hydractinia symbiolongicarpus]
MKIFRRIFLTSILTVVLLITLIYITILPNKNQILSKFNAATDLTSTQSSCLGKKSWKSRYYYNLSLQTDVRYCKYNLRTSGEKDIVKLTITTFDGLKRQKVIGGDSWRLFVQGAVYFNADVIDKMDGTYEARLELPVSGDYKFKLELEYSLCDGIRDPPTWWFINGTEHCKYQTAHLDRKGYIYKTHVLSFKKSKQNATVRVEKQTKNNTGTCIYVGTSKGYWARNGTKVKFTSMPKTKLFVFNKKHKQNTTLWVYGDSLGLRYYSYLKKRFICTDFFKNCKVTYNWVYPLYRGKEIARRIYDKKDFNDSIVLNDLKNVLTCKEMRNPKSVLLLNFGLHTMMGLTMNQSKTLLINFVKMYRNLKKIQLVPMVIWKTTTPTYRKYKDDHRFLTNHRIKLWNEFAKLVSCEENFPIFDIYHVAASYPNFAIDGIHFAEEVFDVPTNQLENFLAENLMK